MTRAAAFWLALGWIGYLVLPWYILDDSIWSFTWLLDGYPFDGDAAAGLIQATFYGKVWLTPVVIFLIAPLAVLDRAKSDPLAVRTLLMSGAGGLAYLLAQGFAIGIGGWEFATLEAAFGPLGDRQFGSRVDRANVHAVHMHAGNVERGAAL